MSQPTEAAAQAFEVRIDVEKGPTQERDNSRRHHRCKRITELFIILAGFSLVLWCMTSHWYDVEDLISTSRLLNAIQASSGSPIHERFAPVKHDNIPSISDYINENNPSGIEPRQECNPLSPLCTRGGPGGTDGVLHNPRCGKMTMFKALFTTGLRSLNCSQPQCNFLDHAFNAIVPGRPICIEPEDYKRSLGEWPEAGDQTLVYKVEDAENKDRLTSTFPDSGNEDPAFTIDPRANDKNEPTVEIVTKPIYTTVHPTYTVIAEPTYEVSQPSYITVTQPSYVTLAQPSYVTIEQPTYTTPAEISEPTYTEDPHHEYDEDEPIVVHVPYPEDGEGPARIWIDDPENPGHPIQILVNYTDEFGQNETVVFKNNQGQDVNVTVGPFIPIPECGFREQLLTFLHQDHDPCDAPPCGMFSDLRNKLHLGSPNCIEDGDSKKVKRFGPHPYKPLSIWKSEKLENGVDVTGDTYCGIFDKFKDFWHLGHHPNCHDKSPICDLSNKIEGKLHVGDAHCMTQKEWDDEEQKYQDEIDRETIAKRSVPMEVQEATPTSHEPRVDDEWLERYKVYRQQQEEDRLQREDDDELDIEPRGWFDWLKKPQPTPNFGKKIDRVTEDGDIQVYENGPVYDGDCGMYFDSAGTDCIISPGKGPSDDDDSPKGDSKKDRSKEK